MLVRRLQLRRLGKAIVTCIVAVNLLCFATLYSLYSEPAQRTPHARGVLPWAGHVKEGSQEEPLRESQEEQQGKFISPCKELTTPPPRARTPDVWKTVVANGTYVYSAYYDNRTAATTVVIFGMSSGEAPRKWCQLWYKHRLVVVPAKYDIVPETHGRKYAPSFHICQVEITQPPPYAVSLVVEKCDTSESHLVLHIGFNHAHQGAALPPSPPPSLKPPARYAIKHKYHENQPFDFNVGNHDTILGQKFKYNYTVCVTPFNFNYRNVHQLVEIIEVNRLFGADHFVFYNYDSAPDIQPYLKYYSERGIVDVLPWNLPVKVNLWPPVAGHEPEVHYFAQTVALNDCIYRSMFDSKYAVLTDLDEVIVPQVDTSWDSMLSRVGDTAEIGAWLFQNTFFRTDWPDTEPVDPVAKQYQIRTLLKLKREDEIFPPNSRSKVILRPQLVTMTGVHFVYKLLDPRIRTEHVEAHNGLLHHYRIGFNGVDPRQPQVDAKIMLQYKSPIITQISRVYDAVGPPVEK